jgi:hypothetical protein
MLFRLFYEKAPEQVGRRAKSCAQSVALSRQAAG